ncbi:AAA family ATPase [Thermopirellula anaerolimosa]
MDDTEGLRRLAEAAARLKTQLGQVIVGQQNVIDELLMALFARGHCLLVGVPGLAKTLMIRTLAGALSLKFNRIQFTPDLMPSDITGTEIIQEDKQAGTRELRFVPGPLFANIILADEINRTPPKTQAALLEAMQEYQVTVGGRRHPLEQPFYVLATQNPIEQEGTYPLPEAQLDRFMFHILVDYPDDEAELEVIRRTTVDVEPQVTPVLGGEEILAMQRLVRRIPAPDHVVRYALQLVRATRPAVETAPKFVRDFVVWGAGPRAGQYLVLAAKARAGIQGRTHPTVEDIRTVAFPVLRHRVILNFSAEVEGVRADDLIRRLLDTISLPDEELTARGILPKVFGSSTAGTA